MSSPATTLSFENEILGEKSHPLPPPSSTNKLSSSKSFHISTRGIPLIRLPLAPSELVTNIFDASGSLVYKSTRSKRCSGSCALSSPSFGDLVTTTYHFGPGKPPVLRYVDTPKHDESGEVELRGNWLGHSQAFQTPSGHKLEWKYIREANPTTGKKIRLLVLVDMLNGVRIAQLVRTDETRTEGSKKCSAGNGGVLLFDEDACGKVIDEALVIATCLVMLKKEIDRRRCMQAMMLH
jgi:hypothetical protein